MKKPLLALSAIAVLLPLTVACGGSKDLAASDPTTSSSLSTPPSTPAKSTEPVTTPPPTTPSVTVTSPGNDGKKLTGQGYSLTIPDGWEDITASLKAKNPSLDEAIGESQSGSFRTNFNVVQPTPTTATVQHDAVELHKEAASELKSVTSSTVSSLPNTSIDGEPAIGQTSKFTTGATPITFIQYIAIHDGLAYPITMTSATENLADAKAKVASILGSWHWTS